MTLQILGVVTAKNNLILSMIMPRFKYLYSSKTQLYAGPSFGQLVSMMLFMPWWDSDKQTHRCNWYMGRPACRACDPCPPCAHGSAADPHNLRRLCFHEWHLLVTWLHWYAQEICKDFQQIFSLFCFDQNSFGWILLTLIAFWSLTCSRDSSRGLAWIHLKPCPSQVSRIRFAA